MGTIAAALAGGAAGAVGGGIIGALIGAGIPEERARRYDRGIREGKIVLGVTPRSEEDAEYFERDEGRAIWKVNPLVEWTDKDVWRYIAERDLPYNPLHDQGYDSIGDTHSTQPGKGREGRWAGTERTECGIHT